jgi:hypothetical protein
MDIGSFAADPAWLPHQFDRARGTIEFVHVSRRQLRDLPFLHNRHLDRAERRTIDLADLGGAAAPGADAPCHFIFHSALCCSTLLARALDMGGQAMSLKEPHVLGSLLDAGAAPGAAEDLRQPLSTILALLGRPFAQGETIVIKPRSADNWLLDLILEVKPDSKALLLHAPLPGFLLSVAAKGQAGRVWARRLAARLAGWPEADRGSGKDERAAQSDLQVAARAWLQQQARFARLVREQPAGRIATLDSDALLADPVGNLAALSDHFGIGLDAEAIAAIVDGPVFARDSKMPERSFDTAARRRQRAVAKFAYGAEIDSAVEWAENLAAASGVPMRLDARLPP